MLTCFFSIQKIFGILVFWGLLVILNSHKVTLVYSFTDILSRDYYNVGGPLICTTYSLLKLPVPQGSALQALQLPVLGVWNGGSREPPAWVQARGQHGAQDPHASRLPREGMRARRAVLVFHKPQLKPPQN